MKIRILIGAYCLLISLFGFSQTSAYQIDDLISLALKENLSLAVTKNQQLASENLATKAQAGFLPSFAFTTSFNGSSSNTNLEFAVGLQPIEVKNAQNIGINSNIGLNYTIFNGFGRIHTYNALVNSQKMSYLQMRVISENLLLEVVNSYLDAQNARISLTITIQNFELSKERYARIEKAVKSGTSSNIDLLSAAFDKNQDSLQIMQLDGIFQKQKLVLNLLCGNQLPENWKLSEEIPTPDNINFDEIAEKTLKNEASILLARIAKDLSQNQLKIAEARRMPEVNLQAGYNYLNQRNGAGIILSQQVAGPAGTINFSIPIFNGKQLSTAIKNSELDFDSKVKEETLAKLRIETDLEFAKIDWKLLQKSLILQYDNVTLAETNYERATQAFQRGLITYIELRTIQLQIQRAKNLVTESNIQLLKLSYSLLRASGELLQ